VRSRTDASGSPPKRSRQSTDCRWVLRSRSRSTGHVGANWVGYITVTDGTERGLADVSELIEDAASRAGIRTLEWLEVDSATANAFTWPVGRGIAPANVSIGSKVEQFAQGKEAKEAL
jgi:hypothetical protein